MVEPLKTIQHKLLFFKPLKNIILFKEIFCRSLNSAIIVKTVQTYFYLTIFKRKTYRDKYLSTKKQQIYQIIMELIGIIGWAR